MSSIENVKQLQRELDKKNKELKDIKTECIEVFREINELCLSKYSDTYKLNKVRSLACDQYLLLMQNLCMKNNRTTPIAN